VRRILLFALVLLPSLSPAQTTATFQNAPNGFGYTGGQDTDLSAKLPNTNLSTASGVGIGRVSNFVNRPLFRFDLSSIARAYSSITQIQFTLTEVQPPAGADTLLLHEVDALNSNWIETSATWNTKDGTNAWDGGVGLGASGYGSVLDSESYTSSTTSITFTITGPAATNLVNDFTSASNPGFVITSWNETTGNNNFYFETGTLDSGSSKPKLSITYVPAPEPAATGLLIGGLAAVGLRRRRREVGRGTGGYL